MAVTAKLPRVKWELSHARLTAVKLDFDTCLHEGMAFVATLTGAALGKLTDRR